MRKPSASERRLLAIFGFMLFALLNLVVVRWYAARRQELSAEVAGLKNRAAECRLLLEERPHWEARQKWLGQHPLEFHQGPETDSRFVEDIQHSLSESGLAINTQQIRESVPKGGLIETQMQCNVKGSLEQIVRWLARVQQPGNHLVIESLTLKQIEGEGMTAEVLVGKIFRAGGVAQAP